MQLRGILLVLACAIAATNCSKILITSVFPGKSHWLMFEHVIKELLNRGHEVTAITNYKLSVNSSNYTAILIEPAYDIEALMPMESFFVEAEYSSIFTKISTLWWLGYDTCEHALRTQNVRDFLQAQNQSFDLLLAEQFFQESFLILAKQFNAPIVTIATLGYFDFMDRFMGLLTPWSHVSHYMLGYGDNLDFVQRLTNVFVSLYDLAGRNYYYMPQQERLVDEYFPVSSGRPSLNELEKSVSLLLVNSHRSLAPPRPKIEGMIDIAGLHIRAPEQLPSHLQEFLDGAEHGAIYFSFGTFMKSSEMPEKTLAVFLKVFSRLKQRVLWKWENEKIPNLSSNVLVQKWTPQNDVLAHPNMKLFITHGGLFSSQEAIARRCPMILFPFYGDQYGNAEKMREAGVGIPLTIRTVTEADLEAAILSILGNRSYYDKISAMSSRFLDNPVDPLQEAVYWIEYVLHHKGAAHLKSASVHLPWYQYLLLDMVGALAVVILVTCFAICALCSLVCSRKKVKDHDKNKKWK